MNRRLFGLFLLVLSWPSLAGAFGLDQLMRGLAAHPGGTVRFVETRHVAILDAPIVSTGEMTYTPPDRLEKRTLKPRPERLLLEQDTLTLERDQRRMSLRLSSRPEVMAFVDSIRDMLGGHQAALERNYLMQPQGTQQQWVLVLYPKDHEIAALVQRITVNGREGQVRSIEYLQADGDRTVIEIEPLKP
ncbi:MAG: LolA-related protein [Burkholderiaceae bacterium]